MLKYLLLLTTLLSSCNTSHFNGGTIRWVPVDGCDATSPIEVTLIQTYIWTLARVACPTIGSSITPYAGDINSTLTCTANCGVTSSGFIPPSIIGICTGKSSVLGLSYSQRTDTVNLNSNDLFTASFKSNTGSFYRLLNGLSSTSTSAQWILSMVIDLQWLTNKGRINTPPVAMIVTPVAILVGIATQIQIPVGDVDSDQDVRCRWSVGTEECADVCFATYIPPGTILSTDCALTITGLVINDWYAAAIQVEDFQDNTTTVALSSVPVQFLIRVYATPSYSLPTLTSNQSYVDVDVGIPFTTTLFATNYGGTSVSISSIIIQTTFFGATQGSLIQETTNNSLYSSIVSWTPTSPQVGIQILCALAVDSFGTRSQKAQAAHHRRQLLQPLQAQPAHHRRQLLQSLQAQAAQHRRQLLQSLQAQAAQHRRQLLQPLQAQPAHHRRQLLQAQAAHRRRQLLQSLQARKCIRP
ncbi:unnamed protein product [Didymodactylos carnosus]|uniref:Uncharacterized protein n=1 Tax=Didymodactylos carnosus TaxID=1234261 RepID=A0A8S2JEV2_9BILA|nr:unnamed protein product [Didymodactylos carnosus]CAF3796424.1 unnamed protein product [Didymodactylos carnosus]